MATPVSIRIDDDVKVEAQRIAEAQGLTLAQIVNQLLRVWVGLPGQRGTHDAVERWRAEQEVGA